MNTEHGNSHGMIHVLGSSPLQMFVFIYELKKYKHIFHLVLFPINVCIIFKDVVIGMM